MLFFPREGGGAAGPVCPLSVCESQDPKIHRKSTGKSAVLAVSAARSGQSQPGTRFWGVGWWCLAGAHASAAVPQRLQHSWVLTANKSGKNDHASSNSDLKSGVTPILQAAAEPGLSQGWGGAERGTE
eukprot:gene11929-biopygen13975